MSILYQGKVTRTVSLWDKIRSQYQANLTKTPPFYHIVKMDNPNKYLGGGSAKKQKQTEFARLARKFFHKYPEAALSPTYEHHEAELHGTAPTAPTTFLTKQTEYMRKGYSEGKSFEMAEHDMNEDFVREKEEQKIVKGLVYSNASRSYLDRYQQMAELEARQKVARMERDVGKYMRQHNRFLDVVQTEEQQRYKSIFEGVEYGREQIDEYFQVTRKPYSPTLFEVVKEPSQLRSNEQLNDIQEDFVTRAERLLEVHQSRSFVHDGLSGLSDRQVIQKIREVPTKMKRNADKLVKKLDKYGIQLLPNGDIDYSAQTNKGIVAELKQNEQLVKIILMQRDLEWEYPQKLERLQIKSDILELCDLEEKKMQILQEKKDADEFLKRKISYSEFYEVDEGIVNINDIVSNVGSSRQDTKFEDYVKEKASKYIFDNDLLEKSFKYWETDLEKEQRLKAIWVKVRKSQAEGNIDARTPEEQQVLQDATVSLIRKLRWKVDQELVKNNVEPIFKEQYLTYDKEEFLLDSEIEFYKLKKLLEKHPKVLREDPMIGMDYMKIIGLVRRKKILEYTVDPYSQETNHEFHWDDVEKEKRKISMIEEHSFKRELNNIRRQQEMSGQQDDEYDLGEEDTERSAKALKKQEAREKGMILKQFEQFANKVESGKLNTSQDAKEETSRQAKNKKKVKGSKTKSLAAKLRLKTKNQS